MNIHPHISYGGQIIERQIKKGTSMSFKSFSTSSHEKNNKNPVSDQKPIPASLPEAVPADKKLSADTPAKSG